MKRIPQDKKGNIKRGVNISEYRPLAPYNTTQFLSSNYPLMPEVSTQDSPHMPPSETTTTHTALFSSSQPHSPQQFLNITPPQLSPFNSTDTHSHSHSHSHRQSLNLPGTMKGKLYFFISIYFVRDF